MSFWGIAPKILEGVQAIGSITRPCLYEYVNFLLCLCSLLLYGACLTDTRSIIIGRESYAGKSHKHKNTDTNISKERKISLVLVTYEYLFA